jgi:hypothetical protein
MTRDHPPNDVGPATPLSWCLPDAEPSCDRHHLTEPFCGGTV